MCQAVQAGVTLGREGRVIFSEPSSRRGNVFVRGGWCRSCQTASTHGINEWEDYGKEDSLWWRNGICVTCSFSSIIRKHSGQSDGDDATCGLLPCPARLLSNGSPVGESYSLISNSRLRHYVQWWWSFLRGMYLHVTVCFGRRAPCSPGGLGCLTGRPVESLVPEALSGGFPGGALLTGTCSSFSCRRGAGLEVVLVSFSLRKLTRPAGNAPPGWAAWARKGSKATEQHSVLHLTFWRGRFHFEPGCVCPVCLEIQQVRGRQGISPVTGRAFRFCHLTI